MLQRLAVKWSEERMLLVIPVIYVRNTKKVVTTRRCRGSILF